MNNSKTNQKRIELHNKLCTLCDHVYFQPPKTERLIYPCIKYNLIWMDLKYADNEVYLHKKRYQVTYITQDPDDPVVDALVYLLPYTRMDRQYKSDNLYHNVYDIYY